MASYSESNTISNTSSSRYSLSRDHDWSFTSTSSSSTQSSNITSSTSNIGANIPCFSDHHTHYYHCVATFKTQPHHHITCLAVHHNLLYAASGNHINVFDLATLSPVISKDDEPVFDLSSGGFIKAVGFYGEKILTAHQDARIRVWKRHRLVVTLPTVKDRLCRFLCPKSYVQVRRHKRKLWIEHNDAVSGLAVNNKDGLIYSVSWDKTLKVWRGSDFKCLESLTAHEDAVNAVAVSVTTGTVYTGSADGKIRVWERNMDHDRVGRHSMVGTLEKHASTVNALALSKDGKVLLSGGCDGVIMAWESDDHMVVGGHDGAVLCLISLNVDGHDLFVSGSGDRTVRIWGRGERGLFCCLAVMEGHQRPVRSVAIATTLGSDGERNDVVRVCSGSLDGEIKIWEVMVDELMSKFKSPYA